MPVSGQSEYLPGSQYMRGSCLAGPITALVARPRSARRAIRRPSTMPGYSEYRSRQYWRPAWFSMRHLRRPALVSRLTATLSPPARTQYLPQAASFLRRKAVRTPGHSERSIPSAPRTRVARSPATDEGRRRKFAVVRLAPQEAGVARSSDRSRTDFCGQDISIER